MSQDVDATTSWRRPVGSGQNGLGGAVDYLGGVGVLVAVVLGFVAWWLVERRRARRLAARVEQGQLTTTELDGVAGPTDGSGQIRLAQSMGHTGAEAAASGVHQSFRGLQG
jgi:uncharacterized membrane protein YqiK